MVPKYMAADHFPMNVGHVLVFLDLSKRLFFSYIFLWFLLTWVTCDIQWILKMDLMSMEINWILSFDWAKSIKASNTVGRADFFSLLQILNGIILRSFQSEKKMAEGAGQRRVGVIADINNKYMMNIYIGWVLQISAGRQ